MSSKKFLIKRLMDYPEISNKEYLSLLNKKKSINNNKELDDINEKIELYNEKQMIINLIKNPCL
jgi:hypothetical protein